MQKTLSLEIITSVHMIYLIALKAQKKCNVLQAASPACCPALWATDQQEGRAGGSALQLRVHMVLVGDSRDCAPHSFDKMTFLFLLEHSPFPPNREYVVLEKLAPLSCQHVTSHMTQTCQSRSRWRFLLLFLEGGLALLLGWLHGKIKAWSW